MITSIDLEVLGRLRKFGFIAAGGGFGQRYIAEIEAMARVGMVQKGPEVGLYREEYWELTPLGKEFLNGGIRR